MEPKLLIKSFYEATQVKPRTLSLPAQLFLDLSSLTKEEIGPDTEVVQKVLDALKGFGFKKETVIEASNREFTARQWRRLRGLIKKHCREAIKEVDPSAAWFSEVAPVKKLDEPLPKKFVAPYFPFAGSRHRVDLTASPPDAVAALMSLIDSVGSDQMSSSITVPVMDYFAFIEILSEEDPDLPEQLGPVRKVLEGHGWTDGGFERPPDSKLLSEDLQALIGRGLESYRRFRTKPPRLEKRTESSEPESLVRSLVSSLVLNLEPETAAGTIQQFLEIADSVDESDEEINRVKQLLKQNGWLGDHFDQPLDCLVFRNELKTLF